MLKRVSQVILVMSLILSFIFGQGTTVMATSQSDMTTIKGRLKEYFLGLDTIDDGAKVETCYVSQAEDYLKLIQENGAFDDVDYQAHNNAANGAAWSPYLALDRLQAIAIAYNKQGHSLYHSEEAKNGIDKALKYWVTQGKRDNKPDGPYSDNWWENEVGVQLRFARIGLFMEGIISDEASQIILDKLLEKKPLKYGTGQNNLWFDQNYVYHALLTNDASQLKEMIDLYLNYCLSIQLDDNTAEAVQVDNSFYMHGKQFYSNGYGMSMFRDMSFWIYMLRETDFSIGQDVVDRMADYMLDGTSWTVRGDIMELYHGYRPYKFDVGYNNYAEEYIEPLKRMIVSDPTRANRYQAVLDNVEGKTVSNGKNGNYYMWRSGYGSHMRDDYGVNIKMDSKNLIGGEWRGNWPAGQNKGQLIYWTSSATSTITVDGDEYTTVYPTFDWAHCPGATTANRIVDDFSNYGRFTNGTDHMIGVSDGKYGSNAYVMNKKETQATKGYFFFDDEFVALGAGINSKDSTAIHTTLNQSKANHVTVDGQTIATGTKAQSYSGNWIHNDKVGYVFPEETAFRVSHTLQEDNPSLWGEKEKQATPETFTAWVDHGVKPQDQSYEYIVLPNKTASEVEAYSKDISIKIVSNTKDIQAVRHDGLKLTQINFYKAGTLEYAPGKTVTVDQPCNVIIDESDGTRKITVAVNDALEHQNIDVNITSDNIKTTTTFTSQPIPYAGQSMTLTEGQDDRYLASSSTDNHLPKNVFDGKNDTYWESQTNQEEWVSTFTNTNSYITKLDILWGDHFAKSYDIYVSQNGIDYKKVNSVKNGKGKEETVNIGEFGHYIKIAMKAGDFNNYQIKELNLQEGELISLNKPTETSSVSQKAPTFVGSLAVDGDTSTRWASNRNSDDEWITVDLQGQATINAIEINWENACSDDYVIQVSNDNKTWTDIKQLKTDISLTDSVKLDKEVTGRYVRIHSYKSRLVDNTNYGINIFEIKIYGQVTEVPQEINIALNKPSKASSERTNPVTGFVLESQYAFDGSTENRGDAFQSRWVSATRKDNPGIDVDSQYIYVDLQDNYDISKVVLNWEGACAKKYKIQVSDNGKEWKDISDITDGKAGIKEFIYDQPHAGRYVRMLASEPSGQYGYSLWEFEVYGKLIKQEEINRALNKPSIASSERTNPVTGFVLESQYAFDGSTENRGDAFQSRWVSATRKDNPGIDVDSQYIYVDLQDNYDISKVVLNWEGACAKKYKIQVSDNGKEWKDISDITDGKAGIKEFTYDQPHAGRYVRMLASEPSGQYGYSLWEFEVYGLSLKAQLKDYYDQNKDIETSSYTPKSVDNYRNALQQVIKVYEDKDATSTQILKAKAQLESAIKNLVKKANKEVLNNEIKKAEMIEKNLYTLETVKTLELVLKQAKEIYQDVNVSQGQVDKIIKSLQNAIESLEKKKDDPNIAVPEENSMITVQNADKGVTVKGKLPKDIKLSAKHYNDQQIKQLINKINKQNSQSLKNMTLEQVYDLELLLNQQIYNVNGELEISLKISDDLKDKNLGIVYIDDQGTITNINSVRVGQTLVFKTTHLSTYAIVSYNRVDPNNVVNETVKTEDDTSIEISVIALGIVTLAFLLLRKKQKG